jgi:hypothetical protein
MYHRAMRIAATLVVLAGLSIACDREQTEREAMELVCDVEARAGVGDVSPAERAHRRAEPLERKVSHPEVRRLLQALGDADRDVRKAALLEQARAAGLTDCKAAHPDAP